MTTILINLPNILKYFKIRNKSKKESKKEFKPFSYYPSKIYNNININTNNITSTENNNNLTYCTICDLLHIDGYAYEHCKLCNKCHKKFKLYCLNCKNCYDFRLDKDIISHRKNCLSAYKNF